MRRTRVSAISGTRRTVVGVAGAVLMGLTALTVSACGPAAAPAGTPTPIPTSDWNGGPGMAALLEGSLTRDVSGCLVVGGVVVLWPQGYTAVTRADGVVEVRNVAGAVVARTGAPLHVGGGEPSAGTLTGPCLTGREVFAVNDTPSPLG